MHKDNLPRWNKNQNGFYEVWYLKLNTPSSALWLRLTTLSSKNGLKKVAEVWAMYFEPTGAAGQPVKKIAIKNTASVGAYECRPDQAIAIEDCLLGPDYTRGCVVSRGQRIDWDLHFTPNDYTFMHVPEKMRALKLTKSVVCKPNMNIFFSGQFSINGQVVKVENAPGCQGHIWGTQYAHCWAWAHCNLFSATSESAAFEILSAKVKLGNVLVSPQMSALFFEYKGRRYEFNRVRDMISVRSQFGLTQWKFSADRDDLRLSGRIYCDVKDLLAVTYEDTNGSFLYCNNTELASCEISVYSKGKLETTLYSARTTGFETVSRNKSPYIEVLI